MHMRCAIALVLATFAPPALANSLSITPITVERTAPAAAATLTLSNRDGPAVTVQLRIFRWTQGVNGDVLEPTQDVVVSPPFATLKPDSDYTVRVVRISKTPMERQEAYRIFADQLPAPGTSGDATVRLLIRYSIPVFFSPASVPPAKVDWSVAIRGNNLALRAVNTGGDRIRVSHLSLAAGDHVTDIAAGLAGYVLAGSAMSWQMPITSAAPRPGRATLTFDTDQGKINVPVVVRSDG